MFCKILGVYWIAMALFLVYNLHKAHKKTRKCRYATPEIEKGNEPFIFHGYRGYKLPLSYLICVIFGPIRFMLIPVIGASALCSNLLMIGQDREKPMSTWRKKIIQFLLYVSAVVGMHGFFAVWVSERQIEADYSEFLGPNWKEELKNYKKPIPTIICNHSTFKDMMILTASKWFCSYVCREEDKKSIVGAQSIAIQNLFIQNSGSSRSLAREQLMQRQHDIQAGKFGQICVFAEGMTSNGNYLLPFKHGAFATELPVQPIVLRY